MISRSESDPALRALQRIVDVVNGDRGYEDTLEQVHAIARAALAAAEAAPLDDCDERMKAYRARRENLGRRKYEQGRRDAAEAAPQHVLCPECQAAITVAG